MRLERFPISLKSPLLPPLEKGRVGVGIALRPVRPLSAARDPLLILLSHDTVRLTSPFQGEERFHLKGECVSRASFARVPE